MRRAAVLTAVAALAGVVLSSPAPAALSECPPDAPPQRGTCVITVDDHELTDAVCGFPLQLDAVGRILYTPRRDKQGNLVGESLHPNIRTTLTNPANGRTVEDRDVGLDKATFLPDGSVRVLSTGLHAKVRTGDRRTIFRQIGLQIITVDPDGEVVVQPVGGNFQPDEDFERLVCSYLAGG